jgi:hypothetical protein
MRIGPIVLVASLLALILGACGSNNASTQPTAPTATNPLRRLAQMIRDRASR